MPSLLDNDLSEPNCITAAVHDENVFELLFCWGIHRWEDIRIIYIIDYDYCHYV